MYAVGSPDGEPDEPGRCGAAADQCRSHEINDRGWSDPGVLAWWLGMGPRLWCARGRHHRRRHCKQRLRLLWVALLLRICLSVLRPSARSLLWLWNPLRLWGHLRLWSLIRSWAIRLLRGAARVRLSLLLSLASSLLELLTSPDVAVLPPSTAGIKIGPILREGKQRRRSGLS